MTTVFPGWKLPNVYNHEPPDYNCPFCKVAAGLEDEASYTVASDIVRQRYCTAYYEISCYWLHATAFFALVAPEDGLYARTPERFLTTPSQRQPYAEKLRTALSDLKTHVTHVILIPWDHYENGHLRSPGDLVGTEIITAPVAKSHWP